MTEELVLEGLFLYLQKRGFALSFRDYEDALFALRLGYGAPRESTVARERLLWLCETLWVRSGEERQILFRLFKGFPFPSDEEQQLYFPPSTNDPGDTPSLIPSTHAATPDEPETLAPSSVGAEAKFNPRTAHEGSLLPAAEVHPTLVEPFLLTSPSLIPLRSLIIAWRRFRSPARSGPKVEVDVQATIRQRCEQGFVIEPVMLSARRNRAKLLLLLDASQDMVSWYRLLHSIAESLRESQSRLGAASVYYFDRAPRSLLYTSLERSGGEHIGQIIQTHIDSQLLIISEGGGLDTLDKDGANDVFVDWHAFVTAVKHVWSPLVWLNPLPRANWSRLTHRISGLPNIKMMELSTENLIVAIDTLRGLR